MSSWFAGGGRLHLKGPFVQILFLTTGGGRTNFQKYCAIDMRERKEGRKKERKKEKKEQRTICMSV
jgi:hypothetical protein